MGNMHTPCVMTDTDSFYVRLCKCGVIHLCFGATTLNLSPEVTLAVTETLKELSTHIRAEYLPNSAPEAPAARDPGKVIQGNFPNWSAV